MKDIQLHLGDCLDVLKTLPDGCVDAVVTDPPYFSYATVPIRGRGVSKRNTESTSFGMPWGYSLDWIDACAALSPKHWIVFCNYAMLGDVAVALSSHAKIQTVMVWRKSNAPRMTRPVPRMDCEFIFWARSDNSDCGRMREFASQVIDVPMPQAGCMASERVLIPGSGKAAHPCQKPLAVVAPFLRRLNIESVLDPFMGSGTTGVACVQTGRKFIGIEIEPNYSAIARKRIAAAQRQLTFAS